MLYVGQCDISTPQENQAHMNASLSLAVPGISLHLTALLTIRKFRNKRDKEGTIAGFRLLEKVKLKKVEATDPKRGTSVVSRYLDKVCKLLTK